VSPLGYARLQAQPIVLQILECTCIRDCRRDLRSKLLHQVQVHLRIHAGLGVLNAEQARHCTALDQGHDDYRAGLFAGRLRPLSQLCGRTQPILDEQRFAPLHRPAEQSGVDALDARGQARAAALMHAEVEDLLTGLNQHEIELVEAKQSPRFGEDALAELVDAARAVQSTTRFEELGHRPAPLGSSSRDTNTVEAQHEHQHHQCEQREDPRLPCVVQQRRQHARRHEHKIREHVRWLEHAPHITTIEQEEERHDAGVHELRDDRHRCERPQISDTDSHQRVLPACCRIRSAGSQQHEHCHRRIV
jgi:hypothetical protein